MKITPLMQGTRLAPSCVLLMLAWVLPAFAADPVVSGVAASQLPDKKVQITYDLADADTTNLSVRVEASPDNGATWSNVVQLSGDVGLVPRGSGKAIVWDAPAEWPAMLFSQCRIRVYANDAGATPNGETVIIAAGAFQMGDSHGDNSGDEQPVHTVTLSEYEIGKYEVTNQEVADGFNWALGQGLVTATVSSLRGATGNTQEYLDLDSFSCQISWNGSQLVVDAGKGNYPCVEISWWGAIGFCNAKSQQDGLQACYTLSNGVCDFSRNGWRLPTEAEWEKAARGGVAGLRFPNGNNITHADANYYSSSSHSYDMSPTRGHHPTWNTGTSPYTSPVGSFASNGYGLHDMAGNVWEWCHDWHGSTYYGSSSGTDPTGPSTGSRRVFRGGSWSVSAVGARCSARVEHAPTVAGETFGFRLARGR